jgi:hypothetical protein
MDQLHAIRQMIAPADALAKYSVLGLAPWLIGGDE